jgi:arsenite oxidase large subunit
VGSGPTAEGARGKEPVQQAGTNPPAPIGGTERIIGTKRLYADGKFNKPDGRALFAVTQGRGFQAAGKQEEKDRFPFLINNGRANHVWQSAYLDQFNEFLMDRFPLPYVQINPTDMAELKLNPGDLVEVHNENGSTQAIGVADGLRPAARDLHALRLPHGPAGERGQQGGQRAGHPELQADLGSIRKIADAPEVTRHLSFKSQEYKGS